MQLNCKIAMQLKSGPLDGMVRLMVNHINLKNQYLI